MSVKRIHADVSGALDQYGALNEILPFNGLVTDDDGEEKEDD